MDRTVDGVLGEKTKDRFEEFRKFGLAHLAAAHREVAMMNTAEAANMALDGDIVRRIGEHKFRLGACKQVFVGGFVARIPAQ